MYYDGNTTMSATFVSDAPGQSEMKRRIVSLEESEQTEKTLHHLAGRIEELRARLEHVLIPMNAAGGPNPNKGVGAEAVSPLTDRMRRFRSLAQGSIEAVEDILNRLDV